MLRLLITLACFLPVSITAQDEVIDLVRLSEDIVFDGQLLEPFWQEMTSFSTVQHVPTNGAKTSEGEEIYLTYDDNYLYFAARIQGEDIQSPSKKRDEFSLTPDWAGIILDGYNDKENGLGFFTTPSALRLDFTVFEDAIGEFPVNLDWNTYWDVKTTRGEKEWSVEMRIPYSSLQFQEENGTVEMGLIVWRAIASHNEIDTWPHIENQYGEFSPFKPSKSKKIRLKNIKSSNPAYVTPFALAGVSRTVSENAPYDVTIDDQLAAGIDVKYNLTSNLTLDFTVNTDFAQVEADDAQVNLDRFSLFFPEKRQFFQERASIFDLRVGGPNRVFYSRRIGIDDDGNLEKIMGGARITGRIGNHDVGIINMATRTDSWGLKDNFTVLRVRKKVLNSNSYVGIIGTNKTDFKGSYNSVYAVDGTFRFKYNHLFQVRFAQSFGDEAENNPLSMKPSKFFINLEKTQFEGFNYDLAFNYQGDEYNPEMGFENRSDYHSIFAVLGYGIQNSAESKILQHNFRMFNFAFIDNKTGLDVTANTGLLWNIGWKSGYSYRIFTYLRRERLFDEVSIIDGFDVDEGLYKINVWGTGFSTPAARTFSNNFAFRIGDIFDSKFVAFENQINWVVIPDLNVGLFYSYNPIFRKTWDSNEVINIQLARLKFLYTLSTKISFSGFIQATSDGNVGLGNVRFRYNPREGVDLFVVYNNVTDLDLALGQNDFTRGIPEQVLITKLTYTFRL